MYEHLSKCEIVVMYPGKSRVVLWANPNKRGILFSAFLTNIIIKNREIMHFFLTTPNENNRDEK